MISDIIIMFVNIFFIFAILPQILRNYRLKITQSQSLLWHMITVCGYFGLILAYVIECLWFSLFTIILNLILRLILIWQIMIYRSEQ